MTPISEWLMPRKVRRRRRFALGFYRDTLATLEAWARKDTEVTNFYYELTALNRSHLAHCISLVLGRSIAEVEACFAELENDAELKAHLEQGLRAQNLGKDIVVAYGRRIGWYAFIRLMKPRTVIETGVDLGVGGCVISAALLRNAAEGSPGRYYGTDIRREAGQLYSGRYAEAGKILYGDSLESLDAFKEPIDLFINDSDHSADYEYREYQMIAGKLSPQGVILGDNSHLTDRLPRFSVETGRPFLFFSEKPKGHWYPGAGIGISLPPRTQLR